MAKRVTTQFKERHRRHYIREWRKFRGLTQEQLAGRIGMAASTISQLENDKQDYSQATLEALASALSCEPGDLLMRNPAVSDSLWSIEDQLQKADPAKRAEIISVVEVMLRRAG